MRTADATIGMDHPDCLPLAASLSRLHEARGDFEQAARRMSEVLASHLEVHGDRSPIVLHCRLALARLRAFSGEVDDALNEATAVLSDQESLANAGGRLEAQLRQGAGQILSHWGPDRSTWEQGISELRLAVTAQDEFEGNIWDQIGARSDLARALSLRGEAVEAEATVEEILSIRRSAGQLWWRTRSDSLRLLADTLRLQGRLPEALEAGEAALEAERDPDNPTPLRLAYTLHDVGLLELQSNKGAQALIHLRECVDLKNASGLAALQVGLSRQLLVEALLATGQLAEAEAELEDLQTTAFSTRWDGWGHSIRRRMALAKEDFDQVRVAAWAELDWYTQNHSSAQDIGACIADLVRGPAPIDETRLEQTVARLAGHEEPVECLIAALLQAQAQGSSEAVLTLADSALHMLADTGETRQPGLIHHERARALYALGRLEEAEQAARASLTFKHRGHSEDDRSSWEATALSLGAILFDRRRWDPARDWLANGLSWFDSHGEPDAHADVLLQLLKAHLELGDIGAAADISADAIQFTTAHALLEYRPTALWLTADLEKLRGDQEAELDVLLELMDTTPPEQDRLQLLASQRIRLAAGRPGPGTSDRIAAWQGRSRARVLSNQESHPLALLELDKLQVDITNVDGFARLLERTRDLVGPKHALTILAAVDLALVSLNQGEFDQVLVLCDEGDAATSARHDFLGQADWMDLRAQALDGLGRHAEAELARRSASMLRGREEPTGPGLFD